MKIYDYIIIGSGFGGSVTALRLAEKGYSVLVLEQGKQYRPKDFPRTNFQLRHYLWAPALSMYGFQRLSFFRQASILSGVGVGGGSLVYANTLFMPPDPFFEKDTWSRFREWKKVLKPHYDTVSFMLGRQTFPYLKEEDHMLSTVARDMEREETFHTVEVAVHFGDIGTPRDPYFRVFSYPGMYITDGSAIQANIGVNPSFTIAAQAEYAMSLIPAKEGNSRRPLAEMIKNTKP